jgi:hypothetical protein
MKLSLILKHRVSICFILLLLTLSLRGQGNLVFNGGFDVDAAGWTLTDVSFGYSSKGGDPGGFINLVGAPLASPTASQTITGLTPDTVYVISGEYYERSVSSTEYSFGAAIGGNFLFETAGQEDTFWHSFSFLYSATSSIAVLSLASQLNGTGISYGIDNIAMNAIPEPSSICLIFLGSGLLIFVRKRRRNAAQT